MTLYLFHRGGYESRTIIVEAESELEAKGKVQEKLPSGISVKYRAPLKELLNEEESGVLDMWDF